MDPMAERHIARTGGPEKANKEHPARSPVYRHAGSKAGITPDYKEFKTLYEMWERSARLFKNNQCLGWRPITEAGAGDFLFLSYSEVADRVSNVIIHVLGPCFAAAQDKAHS
jgi:hypothetical protein